MDCRLAAVGSVARLWTVFDGRAKNSFFYHWRGVLKTFGF